MNFTTDELELLRKWYQEADSYDRESALLVERINEELYNRADLESFVSDCGDSCKL